MTLKAQKIWHLPLLLLALWLGGCAMQYSEDELKADFDSKSCIVQLQVNLGGGFPQKTISRASSPWDDGVEGVGLENYIDLDDLHVYLFSSDDKLIAHLTDSQISRQVEFSMVPKNSEGTVFQIQFRVDELVRNPQLNLKSMKVVMLANWGNAYPSTLVAGTTTINDLTSDLDSGIGEFTPTGDIEKIPFFGVQLYEDIAYVNDAVTVLPEKLHLLRAFAKIEIYDDEESYYNPDTHPNLLMSGVELVRYNNKYYKAPQNIVSNEGYLTQVPDLSLPTNKYSWEKGERITLQKNEYSGHYVIYVPEYKNIARDNNDTRSKLIVSYPDGNQYDVEFKYYNDPPAGSMVGDYFDIHRNHWYEYIVKRSNMLEIIVDVIPFKPVELKPEYGLERDQFTGYIIGKDEDGNDCWYGGVMDPNWYDSEKITPYYFGPSSDKGKFVEINGEQYLLVYRDNARTLAELDHIYDSSGNLYDVSLTGITAYERYLGGWDAYINNMRQLVWLENTESWACYLTVNEWDRYDWDSVKWAGATGIYPKYWFDVLGHKYSWPTNDVGEKLSFEEANKKKKEIIGDWADYLK